MLRSLKTILFIFLFLIAITLLLEVGFRGRSWLESQRYLKEEKQISENRFRILFIGDSILGFLDDESSLASLTAHQLSVKKQDQFEFKELSAPALRTNQVASKLEKKLIEYRPQAVLMMVGKSDFSYVKGISLGPLSGLKVARLLEAVFWELRNKWMRFSAKPMIAAEEVLQSAWNVYSPQDCSQSIPLFERAINQGIDRDRPYRALHYCYINDKKIEDGIRFFQEIKDKSQHKILLESFIAVLEYLKMADKPDAKDFLKAFEPEVQTRDMIRTKLWFYREANQSQKFYQEFVSMPTEVSGKLSPESIENLKKIHEIFKAHKTKVLFLQYPFDDVSALQSAFGKEITNFHYVDLKAWLEKVKPEELMAMWNDDLEHLSPIGAKMLSQKLAEVILEQSSEKK